MEQIYDLIIIGSGPAGLGAAIYAKRAELETLVIEKEIPYRRSKVRSPQTNPGRKRSRNF